VTSVIAFEGRGNVLEYVGGYDDWIRQGGKWTESDLPESSQKADAAEVKVSDVKVSAQAAPEPIQNATTKPAARVKKLSYKLQKEFEELPQKIEQLEKKVAELQLIVGAADFYSQPPKFVEEKLQALAQVEQELESCFERWAELEDMQQGE
jgi:ATP-binding cassette subfamily F protein uup